MPIERNPDSWKGTHAFDLAEFLEVAGAVFTKVIQPTCDCGSRCFRVAHNFDAAVAQATCTNCERKTYLGDSTGSKDAPHKLAELVCDCGSDVLELGLCVDRDKEERRWLWTALGCRCIACGLLDCCANRCMTASWGEGGSIGGFANPDLDRELLKVYPLQLYEVVYPGGAGDPDGADGGDAIYLVSAKDHEDAIAIVDRNASHWDGKGRRALGRGGAGNWDCASSRTCGQNSARPLF